jgi:hypothetical protein
VARRRIPPSSTWTGSVLITIQNFEAIWKQYSIVGLNIIRNSGDLVRKTHDHPISKTRLKDFCDQKARIEGSRHRMKMLQSEDYQVAVHISTSSHAAITEKICFAGCSSFLKCTRYLCIQKISIEAIINVQFVLHQSSRSRIEVL